jgi:hypothetical protein
VTDMAANPRLSSRALQFGALVIAFLVIAALHWHNDGLWFQGDAPRHAIDGFFWWDFLGAMPRDPIGYALSYYARYPVIAPATYPPLFALIEGVGYRIIAPSPYVARGFVLAFAIVAGAYVMAWLRRWIDASLGWAAAFLAFVPAFVLWSNAVMLNVPATALAVASLYHFRRALDGSDRTQLAFTALFLMAVALTYYPAVSVLAVLMVWAARRFRVSGLHARSYAIAGVAVAAAAIPLSLVVSLAPVHTARNLPTLAFLLSPATWTYYWRALPDVVGVPALMLGAAGCAAGLLHERWRTEALFVAAWIAVPILSMSVLPARDPRYILLVAPGFIVGSAIAVACLAPRIRFAGGDRLGCRRVVFDTHARAERHRLSRRCRVSAR